MGKEDRILKKSRNRQHVQKRVKVIAVRAKTFGKFDRDLMHCLKFLVGVLYRQSSLIVSERSMLFQSRKY